MRTTRISVGDVAFDDLTMIEAVTQIVLMTQKTDRPRYICTGNLDHLVTLSHDSEFRAVYSAADLVLADGAPIVWLSHLNHPRHALRERVAGSDLFWELARASAATGMRLFFLGGAPGAAEAAAATVCARYPTAQICGTYCPPSAQFSDPAEQAYIQRTIRAAQPDILLVAFGAPKQEKWIAANKDVLGVPVAIGVGGTFEMAGGQVRRAPLWAQRIGLEWAYRFLQEPGRLFHRYFLNDLPSFPPRCSYPATQDCPLGLVDDDVLCDGKVSEPLNAVLDHAPLERIGSWRGWGGDVEGDGDALAGGDGVGRKARPNPQVWLSCGDWEPRW